MNTTIQGDGKIQHIGWPTGTVGGLLLISLGLELLARQVFGRIDVGTLFWALYLGFWTFVLGTIGFLLLAVRWLIEWRHLRANPVAVNRLAPTESTSSRFVKPESEAPIPILHQGESPVDPCRSSRTYDDRNEMGGRMKVA